MQNLPTSYTWFSFPFYAPLSGSVAQTIAPGQYRGVPEIETAVIAEAGSFGRQLGILSEAVVALADQVARIGADGTVGDTGDEAERLKKLRGLVAQVTEIKNRYKALAETEARDALRRLQSLDPDRFASVLRQQESGTKGARSEPSA